MRRSRKDRRMKIWIKNLFFLHVLIIFSCFIRAESARGQSGNYDEFNWVKTGTTAAIVGYTGTNGGLIIPAAIPYGGTNLLVTSIGSEAFSQLDVTSVFIPDGVTDIGSTAFGFCFSLTNVVLGAGVINIESYAFGYCPKLASINIPNGVASIGDSAFQECPSLTSINLPDTVTNIGSMAMASCGATNVISIGSGLISIGDGAFFDCFGLSGFSVDPKNSSYSSPDGALFDKDQTTLVAFPGGVGGNYAIPGTVTNIGVGAFSGALNLTSVTIPDSVISIGANAFFYCLDLTNVSIPDSVTTIEPQAFIYCFNLARITFGRDVTNIGGDAFYSCDNLESLYFRGDAPVADSSMIDSGLNVIAYYLPGTTNWSVFSMNTGIPAALWLPQIQIGACGFGIQTNQFSFNVNWTSGQTITIEGCSNLFAPDWQPLQTNTLTGSSLKFSDPQATNNPSRFYRIISL